jgi:hypothetical protein
LPFWGILVSYMLTFWVIWVKFFFHSINVCICGLMVCIVKFVIHTSHDTCKGPYQKSGCTSSQSTYSPQDPMLTTVQQLPYGPENEMRQEGHKERLWYPGFPWLAWGAQLLGCLIS